MRFCFGVNLTFLRYPLRAKKTRLNTSLRLQVYKSQCSKKLYFLFDPYSKGMLYLDNIN